MTWGPLALAIDYSGTLHVRRDTGAAVAPDAPR